ncbi:MAG: hypothetical protein Q9207_006633 [Kuettlingeria erythrocarpa]
MTAPGPMFTSEDRSQYEYSEVLSPFSDEDEIRTTEDEMRTAEDEMGTGEDATPKTAAELRAERRKMKRFRLTHNQTRFLMSEYARQAHPDAAQRERLSREIPGLSPRQVQVWFQNRRAKLKRLTADDQESVLKSRALPVGFDATQALHYGCDSPAPAGPGRPSSFFHPTQYAHDVRRPTIITGGLRSGSEAAGITSPVSLSSSFGDIHPTYGSVSASETFSPASPYSERSHFFTPPISHGSSPHMQGSSRPRAVSLVLPPHGSMAHIAEQVQNVDPRYGNPAHPRPIQHDLQQDFAFGEEAYIGTDLTQNIPHHPYQAMPYLSDEYPPGQRIAANSQAFYDPSYSVDSTTYPRRASESMVAQRQHIMPQRPLQSAPLAAPIEYPPLQHSSSYRFHNAGPSVNSPYNQIPGSAEPAGISQLDAPYQVDAASLLHQQNCLYQIQREEHDDYKLGQHGYEEWNT